MKRLVAPLALVALIGSGAAACSYGGTPADPAALTMEGDVVVTVRQLEDELAYLDEDPEMAAALLGDASALAGDVTGSYSPTAAAGLLNLHAQMALIERIADDEDIEITEDDLTAARESLDEQLTGMGVTLDELPESLVDPLVSGTAANQAIQAWAAEQPTEAPEVTDEDVQAFFDENRAQLPDEVTCASHVLVAFPTPADAEPGQPTEPTAEDDAAARAEIDVVAERLAAGEDFAAVAEEVSDDPQSAVLGGDLGCSDPAQYVPEFAEAITTQSVGEVGEPVRTDFGYHVILVTYRGEPTAELFEDEIRAQLDSQAAEDPSARLNELVLAAAEAVDVLVDPAFGTWDAETVSIVPPEGAAPPPTMAPALDELLPAGPVSP